MLSSSVMPDRRAALKERHRQAILDAADALIGERGVPRFSVDELAARADVSRRTVFNHFVSLDDVVLTACTRVLTRAVDEFRAATVTATTGQSCLASLFDDLTTALYGMDLPVTIAYLSRVLADEVNDGRSERAIQDVFARTTQQLAVDALVRSPALDELDVQILVSSLTNGVALIAAHWIRLTGAALDTESRAVWDGLLHRLVTGVRAGYATAA